MMAPRRCCPPPRTLWRDSAVTLRQVILLVIIVLAIAIAFAAISVEILGGEDPT